MNFNGKPLKAEHSAVLLEAVAMHNKHFKMHNPEYKEITAEEYLEELINKQLEGLAVGVSHQKTLEAIENQKLKEARQRIGLVP